jgi:hypothetical protein
MQRLNKAQLLKFHQKIAKMAYLTTVILVTLASTTAASPVESKRTEPCNQNTPSYSVCDGNSIVFCQNTEPVAIADCFLAENTCEVVDGTPTCVPRNPCTKDLPFYQACYMDSLHFCRFNQTVAIADCFLAGNTCKVVDGVPACVAP